MLCVNVMCIYFYTYMINGNICYLLSDTYIMRCTSFVLGWRLSTERVVAQSLHYIFFPQVQRCWSLSSLLLPYAHLCEVEKCHFMFIHMELSRVYLYL